MDEVSQNPATAAAIEAMRAAQAAAAEAAAEGEETVSYLIRVRTGVKTSDLGRGVTPATDAAITVVIYGQDGETEPLRLDHWVGVVRECVCASILLG